MVKTKKVFSKTLAALDILGVPYIVKGRNAQLVDHDSLQITLEGEYKDAWFRWSTKEGGRGVETLVTYLMKQGIVDKKAALNFLGGKTNGKSYKLKEVDLKIAEDSNFDEIVYDPKAWQTKEYLIDERKLNEMLVDVVFKRGLILENASGNLVFLQLDKDGHRIGAEVIGTHPDKSGNRVRLNLPGSKGFFYLLGKDCESLTDVERIVFCEGAIDLLSYVELIGYSDSVRNKIPYNIPKSEPKTMYVAIGGSLTKVERMIEQLTAGFGLNLNELQLIIATDNDEAGDGAYDLFKEHFSGAIRENPDSRTVPVKDWNDLLKLIKKEVILMTKTEEKKLSQNIKKEINRYTVKKIFTTETAKDLAEKLFILSGGDQEPYKLKTGKNKGLFRIPKAQAYDIIIKYWDYNIALQFARNELMTVLPNGKYKYDKYNQYRTAERNYRLESQQDNFWANRQGNLDQTIQQINRRYCISRRTREKLVVDMALNQLNVTHFNALRNDFIEYEIFKNNSEVFPTLKHSAGLDYFVDGVPYDQKVSRSLGAMFKKDYDSHDEAVKAARNDPSKLAQSLFENQDVYRLEKGDICNRLYVVYLDESSFENIKFSTRRITNRKVSMVRFPGKPDCYKAMVVFV